MSKFYVLRAGLLFSLFFSSFAQSSEDKSRALVQIKKKGKTSFTFTGNDLFPFPQVQVNSLSKAVIEARARQFLLVRTAEELKVDQEPEYLAFLKLSREQWLIQYLLEKKIASRLTSHSIKKFYEEHKNHYTDGIARVQHILLPDQETALKILKMAQSSKNDFQSLAEKYSIDPNAKINRGELGYLSRFSVPKDLADAVFNTSGNQPIGPIQTVNGFHIIKVLEKKYGKNLSYLEVESIVRADLRNKLVGRAIEEMTAGSSIEILN